MKVVLFCGGLGTRLKEFSETIPKPMVDIGYRPVMWHLMRYYAHFGHTEFILCLGHRGDAIKQYFLNYNECLSNDFVLSEGGRNIRLYNNDIADWTISFVDTGLHANIGQRLRAVQQHLAGEEMFMANYADGLTDLDLHGYVDAFKQNDKIASFLCVQPSQSFHVVSIDQDSLVRDIRPASQADLWINGGFFIFKQAIFDYIQEGEELVVEPFQRLIAAGQLMAYRNPGFWACMDTLKEKLMFDDMYGRGDTPWAVWDKGLRPGAPMAANMSSPILQPAKLAVEQIAMMRFAFADGREAKYKILCLGAHSDDIEIGCGGTIFSLLERYPQASFAWVVFSCNGPRAAEAQASARAWLPADRQALTQFLDFRDGFFPYQGAEIKAHFETLRRAFSPDLILTHQRADLHQDHRLINELTWNTFRDHAILEYEIPKYDGDLGAPNTFVPLDETICRRKIQTLQQCFSTQASKPWFTEETFRAILRLRGVECRAPAGYAEAFYGRKFVV